MKIVKKFEDEEFFDKYHNTGAEQYPSEYRTQGQWFWGLSDDGELYNTSTALPKVADREKLNKLAIRLIEEFLSR